MEFPNGRVPRDPSWCRECAREKGLCGDHRAPDGSPRPYTGEDVYRPTPYVLRQIGRRFYTMHGVDVCDGYDPREGYWMRNVANPNIRVNVSEHALGRTVNEVTLTLPAERLLGLYRRGRAPSKKELQAAFSNPEKVMQVLVDLGYVDDRHKLTPSGLAVAFAYLMKNGFQK